MSFRDEPLRRAHEYAKHNGLVVGKELGFGVHGIVYVMKSQSEKGRPAAICAVKAHRRELEYLRERDVYLRLQENGIEKINGFHVPQLIDYNDNLLILEITIVKRPFVLDFGGAYLDHAPDFSDEVMADWRAEKVEQFGNHWPEAERILRELESYGIHVVDVNPGNIAFRD
jgi:hypothetical protein